MERHFDEELDELNGRILELATRAEEAIAKSVDALKKRDRAMAQDVIAQDSVIDELELSIDRQCLDLIARHQPMANDLRFITTGMKLNAELERIADIAVDIAQRVLQLVDKPLLKPLIDIPKLTELAEGMVHGAIDAFIKRDVCLAKKVALSDIQIDELRNRIQDDLVNDYLARDSRTADRAVPLLLIARFLERICDHATNIAEDVIYMVEAKVVKHHLEKLKNNGYFNGGYLEHRPRGRRDSTHPFYSRDVLHAWFSEVDFL